MNQQNSCENKPLVDFHLSFRPQNKKKEKKKEKEENYTGHQFIVEMLQIMFFCFLFAFFLFFEFNNKSSSSVLINLANIWEHSHVNKINKMKEEE